MNKPKRIAFILVLLLIAGTASAVTWIKSHKQLGKPAVRGTPIPGTIMLDVDLPQQVLEFTTTPTNLPPDQQTLDYLPDDTSFGRRLYLAPDEFRIEANVILMGQDRTSIHKADFCLAGSGWQVSERGVATINVGGANPYPLEVSRYKVNRTIDTQRGTLNQYGLYVFWFVANGEATPSYTNYKLWLMWDMLRTATLQRWAYVSFFVQCAPGKESEAYSRVEKFIAAAAPEIQSPPSWAFASATAKP